MSKTPAQKLKTKVQLQSRNHKSRINEQNEPHTIGKHTQDIMGNHWEIEVRKPTVNMSQ